MSSKTVQIKVKVNVAPATVVLIVGTGRTTIDGIVNTPPARHETPPIWEKKNSSAWVMMFDGVYVGSCTEIGVGNMIFAPSLLMHSPSAFIVSVMF